MLVSGRNLDDAKDVSGYFLVPQDREFVTDIWVDHDVKSVKVTLRDPRADVDEPARPELELREAVAVRPDGPAVVRAGRELTPVRGVEGLLRDDLEVEDVHRLFGRGDGTVATSRERGTLRQEPQEGTPSLGG